jgi:acyl-CoA synthetase (AMP-forming)/AMP-acid ligase II
MTRSNRKPVGETLTARFQNRLDRDSGGRALAFYNPRQRVADWKDFATIHSEASATAEVLAASGCKAGDVCIIVLPSGAAAARLVFAALLSGATPLLIAPPSILGTGSDLARVIRAGIRKTRAKLVICPQSMAEEAESYASAKGTRIVFGAEEFLPEPPGNFVDVARPGATDLAALQLTSGTTGLPKICAWNHRGVLSAIDGMTAAMAVDDDDTFFNWTPLYHDMGLVNNYLTCLVAGIPLVLMSPHDFVKAPASWLRGLSDTKATVTWSPNFGFALASQRIHDPDLEGVSLHHVRSFWNAAERIHLSTMLEFQRRFGPYGVSMDVLKTNFGCAENVGGATFTEAGKPFSFEYVDSSGLLDENVARPVPADSPSAVPVVGAGMAHPLMEMSIRSRTGAALPDGHVGEVTLDTPSAMVGYLGDARSTQRAFRFGGLRTGDLGYLRDGELFWVGRVKERITVRGRKVDPSDFEPVLFDIAGLRKGCFAAFGVDEPSMGTQRVVVVSEVVENLTGSTDELREQVGRSILEKLGLAAEILLVPSGTLTKTSSGKRRHRHFRRAYELGEIQALQVGEP